MDTRGGGGELTNEMENGGAGQWEAPSIVFNDIACNVNSMNALKFKLTIIGKICTCVFI